MSLLVNIIGIYGNKMVYKIVKKGHFAYHTAHLSNHQKELHIELGVREYESLQSLKIGYRKEAKEQREEQRKHNNQN